jgi:hypothetical protein
MDELLEGVRITDRLDLSSAGHEVLESP